MSNAKTAPATCTAACPAGVNVPRYVRHIREGDFGRALAVIREKIPFPGVCGYACVHPCESRCARVQYDEPVAIRLLKRAAFEYGNEGEITREPTASTGKMVAVVGAGPCGLTAAYYLAAKGHRVRVFEDLPEPGGMLRYGIPGYRLPNEVLNRDISFITGHGVEIFTNTGVNSPETLMAEGFNAVLITAGAWKSMEMDIEGERNGRVLEGIAFLQAVNSGKTPVVGQNVVVVGGGNTAIDAARSAIRLGCRVTLLYRRTITQMTAHPAEIKAALEEGVEIKTLAVPVKVNPGSVTCVKTTLGAADDSHRPAPLPVEGSEFEVACDAVIMAVGQTVHANSLNLELNANGSVKVGPELETPKKGVFAAGDAVTGPSTIVEAIAQGRLASRAIDRFLGGTGEIDGACDREGRPEAPEEAPRGTYRPEVENIPVIDRVDDFKLVEPGFDRDVAVKEAGRCLACDARDFKVVVDDKICKGCGYCKEVCSLDLFAINDSFNSQGYKPAGVPSSDHCVGCLRCLYICPDFAINIEKTG